jgi:hypothetical protein
MRVPAIMDTRFVMGCRADVCHVALRNWFVEYYVGNNERGGRQGGTPRRQRRRTVDARRLLLRFEFNSWLHDRISGQLM